uniref:Protein kinase domain-containing protein n=1 Tax=Panagrolaimus sp. ES5 TaxID=591445 RepID=A0AC34F6Q8_9BILA
MAKLEDVKCHSVNGSLTCDDSCETCSQCGNEKSCTNCFPGHFKVSEYYDDDLFACIPTCENFSSKEIRSKQYRYCSTLIPSPTKEIPTQSQKINYSIPATIDMKFIRDNLITPHKCDECSFSRTPPKYDVETSSTTPHKMDIGGFFDSNQLINQPYPNPQCNKAMIYNTLEIINNDKYELGEIIGGGSYSRVFEGKLDGENVAIKMALREGRKSIHKELQIYDKVSHPNILPALGVHLAVENLLFMPLRKFNLTDYFLDYGTIIQIDKLLRYCIQISSAVKYLHEKDILHCDLKIDNILIKDEDGEEVEISDFGCAIDLSHDREARYNGTITHTAYELLKDYLNPEIKPRGAKASDVWAFSVTVWQIYNKSGRIPIDFISPRDIINNYEKGKKLPKPREMPERMWRYIILQCFDLHPHGRPTMKEIYEKLTTQTF